MVFGRRSAVSRSPYAEFWRGAKIIANFFFNLPGTKAVGLFGSLARSERASDVDLIVFNDELYQGLSRRSKRYPLHLERQLATLPIKFTDKEMLKILIRHFAMENVTFDLHVFPTQLNSQFIQAISHDNPDPLFLRNISRDILFWNPETAVFEKDSQLWQEFFGGIDLTVKTEIQLVSGFQHIGEGSAIVIRDENLTVAFDCGANPTNGFSRQQVEKVVGVFCQCLPQYIALTHFHYDHIGAVQAVLEKLRQRGKPWPTFVSTEFTFNLLKEALADTKLATSSWATSLWDRRFQLRHQTQNNQLRLIDTQHSVPGSAGVFFSGTKSIFYTGDCYGISLPTSAMSPPDLLIIDSTGGLRQEPRNPNDEQEARENITKLIQETISRNSTAKIYIALFSTQLERAVWLHQKTTELTGSQPLISGRSLFRNLKTYGNQTHQYIYSNKYGYQVTLLTGVWAQGENTLMESALVRLANDTDKFNKIQPGDVVILSARMPTWSTPLMINIEQMCRRLKAKGARVVVDDSAPENWQEFVEREKVHQGGHGNLPEIAEIIRRVNPKKILPFHAELVARQKVAEFCCENGYEVIPFESLPVFSL